MLNLDNTIAVTENFCNDGNFEKVWKDTRSGRKKLACKWLRLLEKYEPAKYELARALNKEDDFVMYDEREKKKRKKTQGADNTETTT